MSLAVKSSGGPVDSRPLKEVKGPRERGQAGREENDCGVKALGTRMRACGGKPQFMSGREKKLVGGQEVRARDRRMGPKTGGGSQPKIEEEELLHVRKYFHYERKGGLGVE